MGHGAASALFERQARLGSVQRLYLALFIDAQHDGVLRRVQVEPEDIGAFLGEQRIGADLESPR
jgi:hypothetical protein